MSRRPAPAWREIWSAAAPGDAAPVRRARHRHQQALLLHRPPAARPGRAAARPRLPAGRGAEGRRDRRRRGGRDRGPGRAARGRAAGRRDPARDRGWRSAAGGRSRAMCAWPAPLHGRERLRGRPAAPARPRATRGVDARARGAARGPGRGHHRRRPAAQGRARPDRPAARDRGASRSRCAGPALRNMLACLERCHVEVKGVVCGQLRRGRRLPRRGRAGARLPGASTWAAAPPASPTSPAAG